MTEAAPPPAPSIASLQDVVDDTYLFGLDRQRETMDLTQSDGPYGDKYSSGYRTDMTGGTITFVGTDEITVRAHFVGSAAPGPKSWLWGWENVNSFPEPVVARVAAVREFGQRFGITELTTAEVPLATEPATVARRFAAAASLIAGPLPFVTFALENGTVLTFLVESPALEPIPASAIRAGSVLPEAASEGSITNWPRALRAYAQWRGFTLAEEGGAITLRAPNGHVEAKLDDQGGLSALSMSAGPSPA
ncbi:DUF6882 domain-containing protein [Occultella kanbiaonis]|uniref:DUF6882 domain-containing protein n=1 Tax=Occultella kanbiaonis TaxID=2675754 RepID=UPI0013CFFAC5|nr:DUF6882 domain-containing protein [Occultella kanbiaonis]